MRVGAVEKGLSLEARYEFPLPETIQSDPVRVRQVLTNLVGNAMKFTSHGGVDIAVRCITDARGRGATMAFDVRDSGMGMTPEQVERIFEPFMQADASTMRLYGGTGLGLPISRGLARSLGGEIRIESEPGEGSIFTFTLKAELPQPVRMLNGLSEAARPARQPQSSSPAVKLRGRVLLAEDGRDNQLLISTILRKAGAEVDQAVNGRIAMEMALSARSSGAPYDVILMDMQMPEMDGYEATASLRRSGYRGPIIALTAHAMSGDRQKCLDAGCDDYATKPVDRRALLGTLARVMMDSPELGPEESPIAAAPAQVSSSEAIFSEFADDPDMTDIMDEFVAGLGAAVGAMRDALANNHHKELQSLAHQLKGAGGGYGYPQLTDAARVLEDTAKAEDTEAGWLVLNQLGTLCRAIEAGHQAHATAKGANT